MNCLSALTTIEARVVPSLGWLTASELTFGRAVGTGIMAPLAVTGGVRGPVSSYALTVDPYLTFAHTAHV
ncbi:hypothetical protein HanPSC8_Chr09g0379091 [Helianthus annuus]|nr:hypothetical protein HanPSC8_Chr09g0379091 [Helianthus annuus]